MDILCSMSEIGSGCDIYRSVFHAESKSGVGFCENPTGNKMAATIFLNAYRTQGNWAGPSVSDDLMP